MAEWKDILSDNEEQLSEEDLLKYPDSDQADNKKYKIENHPFDVDAKQGLSQLQNKDNLQQHVNQLNQKLQQLTTKRPRKEKRKINIFQWVIVAIILLLLFCVISYVVINLISKSHQHSQLFFISKEVLF